VRKIDVINHRPSKERRKRNQNKTKQNKTKQNKTKQTNLCRVSLSTTTTHTHTSLSLSLIRTKLRGKVATTMFRFAIDRGGTFTDVYAEVPREPPNNVVVLKLLSVDPNNNYSDAPTEAIRLILQQVTGFVLFPTVHIELLLFIWH